jgi:hypothetical protein
MGRRKITPNAWRRNARKIGSFPLFSSSEPRAPDSAGCGRWGALVCGAPGEVFQDAADQTRPGDEGDHAHEASAADKLPWRCEREKYDAPIERYGVISPR